MKGLKQHTGCQLSKVIVLIHTDSLATASLALSSGCIEEKTGCGLHGAEATLISLHRPVNTESIMTRIEHKIGAVSAVS